MHVKYLPLGAKILKTSLFSFSHRRPEMFTFGPDWEFWFIWRPLWHQWPQDSWETEHQWVLLVWPGSQQKQNGDGRREEVPVPWMRQLFQIKVLSEQTHTESSRQGPWWPIGGPGSCSRIPLLTSTEHVSSGVVWVSDRPVSICIIPSGSRGRPATNGARGEMRSVGSWQSKAAVWL